MFLEPRRDAIEYLEHLIQEAAGNAYKTRLLAERILYELSYQARSSRPDHGASPAARRSRTEESPESDAESGWRLVRSDWQVRWRNWRRMLCPPSQFREAPRENGRYGRWTFVFTGHRLSRRWPPCRPRQKAGPALFQTSFVSAADTR